MPTIRLPANDWRPRPYQQPAWDSWERGCLRQLLIWHRRAGKDEIQLNQHAVASHQRVGTYWHLLPEAAQARKAIWDAVNPRTGKRRIDEAFPLETRETTRENDMFIRFKAGSTWQVVGSDNYNSLVGSPPVGVTFSEWALANPSAWAYLAPILAENNGWAGFISTPRGNNHLKGMLDRFRGDPKWFVQVLTIRDTGIISIEAIEEQRKEYDAMFGRDTADMLIEQEFYCSFAGAMVGAYWGAELNRAERDGRLTMVPIDRAHPVHTAWDLGKAINNPIWCFQVIGGHLRIVDFYLPESDDLEDWIAWLNARLYNGDDYVPEDVMDFIWGAKHTRWDLLKAKGRKPKLVKRVAVADGIHAGREAIKVARFHDSADADDDRAVRVKHGLDGLKNYRRIWDDDRKTFLEHPIKDWAEHIGSSWRYLGLAWRAAVVPLVKPPDKSASVYVARADGTVVSNLTVREAVDAMVAKRRRSR